MCYSNVVITNWFDYIMDFKWVFYKNIQIKIHKWCLAGRLFRRSDHQGADLQHRDADHPQGAGRQVNHHQAPCHRAGHLVHHLLALCHRDSLAGLLVRHHLAACHQDGYSNKVTLVTQKRHILPNRHKIQVIRINLEKWVPPISPWTWWFECSETSNRSSSCSANNEVKPPTGPNPGAESDPPLY